MRNSFLTIGALIISGFLLVGCFGLGSGADNTDVGGQVANPYGPESNLLRIGDTLAIQLSGVPPTDANIYTVKVDEDGNVAMPYIGNVKAVDITAAELKNKIEALYKTSQIYTNPTITINSYQERYISVSGEVRSPTRLMYSKDMTVLGVIAGAGGFTDYADRADVWLIRGGKTHHFNAKAALRDPAKDKPLLAGDIVHVNRSVF
ncbi:MAG: polysaccharide export protein [Verrucomicrobiales bacterium]|jgi:polysaccharide export outer membrane protein|nr:polysaccharide export protein [Verrucomicrobiales bacterium]